MERPRTEGSKLASLSRLAASSNSSGPSRAKPSLAELAAQRKNKSSNSAISTSLISAQSNPDASGASNPSGSGSRILSNSTSEADTPPSIHPPLSKLQQLAASRAKTNFPSAASPGALVSPFKTPTPVLALGSAGPKLSKLALKAQQAKELAASRAQKDEVSVLPETIPTTCDASILDEPTEKEAPSLADDAFEPTMLPSSIDLHASPSSFAAVLLASVDRLSISDVAQKSLISRTFAFDTPSPDDAILNRREGTKLAAALKASRAGLQSS